MELMFTHPVPLHQTEHALQPAVADAIDERMRRLACHDGSSVAMIAAVLSMYGGHVERTSIDVLGDRRVAALFPVVLKHIRRPAEEIPAILACAISSFVLTWYRVPPDDVLCACADVALLPEGCCKGSC